MNTITLILPEKTQSEKIYSELNIWVVTLYNRGLMQQYCKKYANCCGNMNSVFDHIMMNIFGKACLTSLKSILDLRRPQNEILDLNIL